MTVENTNREISYTGNNSVTIFTYDFLVYADDNLFVYLDGAEQTTGFTIEGVGDDEGGTVTFTIPPTSGVTVKLERIVPFTQLIDYQQYGPFDAESNERGLDLAVMRDIQLMDGILYKNDPNNQDVIGPITFLEQVTFKNIAPISETLPTEPEHLLRLKDVNISQAVLNSTFSKYPVIVFAGQIEITVPVEFESAIVVIDGVMQFETTGAYTFDGAAKTITLAEALVGTELVEVWVNSLFLLSGGAAGDLPQGARGNPWMFDTCFALVNDLPYEGIFTVDDWLQIDGRTVAADGGYALYQVTDVPPQDTGIRWNFENYIPLDGEPLAATLWAVLVDGFRLRLREQASEIIAHRGFNELGVENTIMNFSNAVKFPLDGFETDWQVTSDGVQVLFHDDTLDSDTNGTGEIKNNTWAALQGLQFSELAGSIWADKVRIPRVEEFFKVATDRNMNVYIEIKQFRTSADIKLLTDYIESINWVEKATIISFNIDDLIEVRSLNSRIGVGWISTNITTVQQFIDFDKLQKLKWSVTIMRDIDMVAFPSIVDTIYDAGISIIGWGLQFDTDIAALNAVGVHRIMADKAVHLNTHRGLTNAHY